MSQTTVNTNANADRRKTYKRQSQARDIWRRFCKNKMAVAALIILSLIVVAACTADIFWDYEQDACALNISQKLQKPSAEHILGTDELGRDILCRLVYGARVSLEVGVGAATFALVIGAIFGAIGGYYGGWIDSLIMRITDVLLAIPGLLLGIAIVSAFKPTVFYMALAFGLSYVSKFTRIIRSAILSIRDQEYVEAARAIGAKDHTIIIRHILLNCMAPILVQYALCIGTRILSVSTLSFIGLGIQAPTPDWGSMLASARPYIRTHTYLVLGPGLALLMTISSFNIIGDGIRDALDPRLKK